HRCTTFFKRHGAILMIRHTPIHFAMGLWNRFSSLLDSLRPLAALVARAYLAQVFFLSGLTKIRDWEITLLLFTEEYQVPLLSPQVAAVMGTGGELVLPVLLLLGLAGRDRKSTRLNSSHVKISY